MQCGSRTASKIDSVWVSAAFEKCPDSHIQEACRIDTRVPRRRPVNIILNRSTGVFQEAQKIDMTSAREGLQQIPGRLLQEACRIDARPVSFQIFTAMSSLVKEDSKNSPGLQHAPSQNPTLCTGTFRASPALHQVIP
jgi:hypothetical protein